MDRSHTSAKSGYVLADLGVEEPDVEVAKADLTIRVYRLAERRRLTAEEAAEILRVPREDLPALFQGRLATCSIDQLLRMLTRLGDDVEILIRPRLQRTKKGALRVLQAAAVENPDDFEAVRLTRKTSLSKTSSLGCLSSGEEAVAGRVENPDAAREEGQLLDKHALEKMTSLDITTIYRKMADGTFPQPVKVGRRRVAWRTADIIRWQSELEVGTESARWRASRTPGGDLRGGSGGSRRR